MPDPKRPLVVGVGLCAEATAADVRAAIETAMAMISEPSTRIAVLATADSRSDHPAVTAVGLPVVSFNPGQLARIEVPNPSAAVESLVGYRSVAEASALLAAGAGAQLVVTKLRTDRVTVAVARSC